MTRWYGPVIALNGVSLRIGRGGRNDIGYDHPLNIRCCKFERQNESNESEEHVRKRAG